MISLPGFKREGYAGLRMGVKGAIDVRASVPGAGGFSFRSVSHKIVTVSMTRRKERGRGRSEAFPCFEHPT